MALNQLGLGIVFTATDAMSGTVDRIARSFSGLRTESAIATAAMGAGLTMAAQGLGIFAAGLMGLDAAFRLASLSGEFTAAIKRAGMVAEGTKGYTDQLAASLRSVAMSAAMATGFDPTEIAGGLESIAAMGFNAQQAISMIRPALDLAAGGGISVQSAASAMTAAIKIFGDAAGSPDDVADKLKGIADFTGLQAKDLEVALGTVGRGAGMAKQNLDEMLLSMGLVKNTGVDATVAASSVSSALIFMAKNAEKFKAIGVNVEDANGKFRDFGDVVLDVGKVMDGSVKGDAAAVKQLTDLFQRFGVTAFQGVYGQLKTGILNKSTGEVLKLGDALAYMRGQLGDAAREDRARTFADAMLATFAGLSKRAEATVEVLKINIGESFEGLFGPVLKSVGQAMQTIAEMFMKVPLSAKKFAAGLFVAAAGLTAVFGASLMLVGAIVALTGATIAYSATLLPIIAIATPIIAIVAAMTAAFAVFGSGLAFMVYENIGGTAKSLQDTFDRWKLIFQAVIGFLTEGKLSGALAEEFMKADQSTQDFIIRATLFFEKIKAFMGGFYEGMKTYMELARPSIDALGNAIMGLGIALGFVDSKYLAASETMSRGDFEKAGATTARVFTAAFMTITWAITTAIDALSWFIDKLDTALTMLKWASGYTALKFLFGESVDAGFGGGPVEKRAGRGIFGGSDGTDIPAGTPSRYGLPPELTSEQYAASAAAEQASPAYVEAEQAARAAGVQEQMIQALRDATSQRLLAARTLTVQSVLDGRVIAESVMSIVDEDNMSSFSGGGAYRDRDE